jgi:hypothetical protein
MTSNAFLDRTRTRSVTSAGEVELPVLYYDASALLCFFQVEHRRAAEVLAGTPFAPVRFGRGSAIAAVVAYDYRATSVGPYREFGTALAVVPRGVAVPTLPALHLLRATAHRDVGWHVLDLPVTTALADVGGREIWGFPKFVTAIDVGMARDPIAVVVQAPVGEEPIVTLEGHAGVGVTLGARDLVLYTLKGDDVLRTVVEARGPMHAGLGRGFTLDVGSRDHPMASRLVALGLGGARAFAAQVCREYRAVLNAPAPFLAAARAA